MKRVRTRLSVIAAVAAVGLGSLVAGAPAVALSNPTIPALAYAGQITSHPWASSGFNASDIEGLGYVAGDSSMWVADDNADSLWEISSSSGAYKTRLRGGNPASNAKNIDFITATQVGTGLTCGQAIDGAIVGDTANFECLSRTDDFESVVYDSGADVLYLTSGGCCSAALPANYPKHPTVWKLTRQGGHFTPIQWQALGESEDPTAAGWRPGFGMYVGKSNTIKTYDFATNTLGTAKTLPVSDVVGIAFSDANTAFITTATPNTASGRTTATSDSTVHKFTISGSSWTEDLNWRFPLKNIGAGNANDPLTAGMIDARDLAIVGDTFWVSDGYDSRPGGDHPIYKYTVGNAVASFVALPSTGNRPLTVQFFDTSTGNPTGWAWDFDNNGTIDSFAQNPLATYPNAGNYDAKLTVTYGGGTLTATQPITVKVPTGAPGGLIIDGFGGIHTVRIGNGTVPAPVKGVEYWPGWDIARGLDIMPDNSGGLTVDGFGGLHRFTIGAGTAPAPVKFAEYWPGWDIIRAVAIMPDGKSGYMLDAFGGTHGFAIGNSPRPPAITGLPYWVGQDVAQGLTIAKDGKGGFMTDKTGVLWPFKIGNGSNPPAANSVTRIFAVPVQGGALVADNTGGMTVDGFGGTHGFGVGPYGPPPAVSAGPYWPGWNIARDIALLKS